MVTRPLSRWTVHQKSILLLSFWMYMLKEVKGLAEELGILRNRNADLQIKHDLVSTHDRPTCTLLTCGRVAFIIMLLLKLMVLYPQLTQHCTTIEVAHNALLNNWVRLFNAFRARSTIRVASANGTVLFWCWCISATLGIIRFFLVDVTIILGHCWFVISSRYWRRCSSSSKLAVCIITHVLSNAAILKNID